MEYKVGEQNGGRPAKSVMSVSRVVRCVALRCDCDGKVPVASGADALPVSNGGFSNQSGLADCSAG